MEILADVDNLVALVTRLPETEISGENNGAVGIFPGLELREKLCGNGGLCINTFVGG